MFLSLKRSTFKINIYTLNQSDNTEKEEIILFPEFKHDMIGFSYQIYDSKHINMLCNLNYAIFKVISWQDRKDLTL